MVCFAVLSPPASKTPSGVPASHNARAPSFLLDHICRDNYTFFFQLRSHFDRDIGKRWPKAGTRYIVFVQLFRPAGNITTILTTPD